MCSSHFRYGLYSNGKGSIRLIPGRKRSRRPSLTEQPYKYILEVLFILATGVIYGELYQMLHITFDS